MQGNYYRMFWFLVFFFKFINSTDQFGHAHLRLKSLHNVIKRRGTGVFK